MGKSQAHTGNGRAQNLLNQAMISGAAWSWTFFGLAVAVLIFVGALVFVDTARKGNRRFNWAQRDRGQSKSQ